MPHRIVSQIALALLLHALGGCVDQPTHVTDASPSADAGGLADGSSPSDAGCGTAHRGEPGIVVTASGPVRGTTTDSVTSYLGVPFADPPRRWRAPEPRACWDGVFDATEFPAPCPQVVFTSTGESTGEVVGADDCLGLNIWAPADSSEPVPVMVYIHGGGNQQGSSSMLVGGTPLFEGDLLAARGSVVVVTIQYRLGPFGYLVHPAVRDEEGRAGNYGLLDQLAALRWVQDNIGAFGGDPSRVMLFGESGGAVDVCALVSSPLSGGLFSSALMQSGACVADSRALAEANGLETAAALGCSADSDRACLEALTQQEWLGAVASPHGDGLVVSQWGASIDGYVLHDVPQATIARGEHNHVALVFGSNAEETETSVPAAVTPEFVRRVFAAFEPYTDELLALYPPGSTDAQARAAYVAATTDSQFGCTARRAALAASRSQEEPVYRYFLEHRPSLVPGRAPAAFHGVELPFVFGTIERTAYASRMTAADRAVVALFAERWSAIARVAQPQGIPEWPVFDDDEQTFVIAGTPRVEIELRRPQCEIWDAIHTRSI